MEAKCLMLLALVLALATSEVLAGDAYAWYAYDEDPHGHGDYEDVYDRLTNTITPTYNTLSYIGQYDEEGNMPAETYSEDWQRGTLWRDDRTDFGYKPIQVVGTGYEGGSHWFWN